ncbi:DUF3299 domain-containing protein [Azoarcus taiwanensis]|uniref:DUF3299 domain-containing protein n=1 Tax=Azoarcus taiwanensis TaxID=666964 RepID=A0A972F6Q4_9RHOO|nr:DUF3299 domain-containing protein [Azoarcus taiwanensis]NMG02015.1 DUF3299 domain-containing protein [Azoarcus taiwanensis]
MLMQRWRALVWACVLGLLSAAAWAQQGGDFEIGDRLETQGIGEIDGFRSVTWDDLIPPDWLPEELFSDLFDDDEFAELDDYDPRAVELMEKILALWSEAPVVERLDGQRLRIPGFVVPLEGDGEYIYEFLLVPYFGACIHVPPPPANQLIHVMPDKPIPARWNMLPVWVNGVIMVSRFDSDMGSAGYQMRGMQVEEYEQ